MATINELADLVERGNAAAWEELKGMAEEGDMDAQYNLAFFPSSDGKASTEELIAWQLYWFERAGKKGHVMAMWQWAELLVDLPFDLGYRRKAREAFKKLVERRDALTEDIKDGIWDAGMAAKIELGIMLCEGNVPSRNYKEGVKLIKAGADYFGDRLKFAYRFRLGMLYLQGYTEHDEEPTTGALMKAVDFFESAASRHNPNIDRPDIDVVNQFLEHAKSSLVSKRNTDNQKAKSSGNQALDNIFKEAVQTMERENAEYNKQKARERREQVTTLTESEKQVLGAIKSAVARLSKSRANAPENRNDAKEKEQASASAAIEMPMAEQLVNVHNYDIPAHSPGKPNDMPAQAHFPDNAVDTFGYANPQQNDTRFPDVKIQPAYAPVMQTNAGVFMPNTGYGNYSQQHTGVQYIDNPPQQPMWQQPYYPVPPYPPQKAKGMNAVLIAVLSVAVLACAVGAYWLYLFYNSGNTGNGVSLQADRGVSQIEHTPAQSAMPGENPPATAQTPSSASIPTPETPSPTPSPQAQQEPPPAPDPPQESVPEPLDLETMYGVYNAIINSDNWVRLTTHRANGRSTVFERDSGSFVWVMTSLYGNVRIVEPAFSFEYGAIVFGFPTTRSEYTLLHGGVGDFDDDELTWEIDADPYRSNMSSSGVNLTHDLPNVLSRYPLVVIRVYWSNSSSAIFYREDTGRWMMRSRSGGFAAVEAGISFTSDYVALDYPNSADRFYFYDGGTGTYGDDSISWEYSYYGVP